MRCAPHLCSAWWIESGPNDSPACAVQLMLLRSEEHTSELQSRQYLVCRLLLEKKKKSGPKAHRRCFEPTHKRLRLSSTHQARHTLSPGQLTRAGNMHGSHTPAATTNEHMYGCD